MILPRTEIDHVSIRKRFWTDQFWKNSIPPRGHWFDLEKYHGTMVYCICSMHKNEFVSSITTLTKSPNIVVRVLVLLWIFYLYNIISWYIIVIIAPVKIDVIPWCGQENGIVYTYNIYNYIVVYIHIIKGGKSPDKSGFRNTKYLALIKGEWVRSFTETSQWKKIHFLCCVQLPTHPISLALKECQTCYYSVVGCIVQIRFHCWWNIKGNIKKWN